jgi:D-amino-acid dehydrogenase
MSRIGDTTGANQTESDSTGDIHQFTSGMAAVITRMGITCRYAPDVVELHSDGKRALVTVREGAQPLALVFAAPVAAN